MVHTYVIALIVVINETYFFSKRTVRISNLTACDDVNEGFPEDSVQQVTTELSHDSPSDIAFQENSAYVTTVLSQ